MDLSNDIDAADVQLVINAALGLNTVPLADVDYSGNVNALDVQLVINVALGIVIDGDGDGLANGAEGNLGTLPDTFDTDGDGVGDGQEVLDGTDPLIGGTGVPPNPVDVAPDIDPTIPTTVYDATAFLYTGSNRVQAGVAAATINPQRVAVLRGKVLDPGGAPLEAVAITVLGHPEFGRTQTRQDGMFDLVVNGGGVLTVNYEKEGYLPAQRQFDTPWQDYIWMSDVCLKPLDAQATVIDFSEPMEVARGGVVTDGDGTRQATVLFPQGAKARMTLRGGRKLALNQLTVRATEFTVGANGEAAMPAELPPNTGYTYCVELSVDEAMAAKAVDVVFGQPVYLYLENFLGFPVGGIVPSGFYDRQTGTWKGSDNGRVIEIVGISGGFAELDTDGDATADNDAALGITDAERAKLATLYTVGQTLWRVPIAHFSPWDCNWPFGPPPGARPPNQPRPRQPNMDDPCESGGSIIEAQNQVLIESISIPGTGMSLHYRSDQVPGRKADYSLDIALTGPDVPPGLERLELEIEIAGRLFKQSFQAVPNQRHPFTWDGKDAYNRTLQGAQPVTVRIGYVYHAVPLAPGTTAQQAFGQFSGQPGISVTGDRARADITIWQEFEDVLGPWDARAQGFGGWTLSRHHAYDRVAQTVYFGDGTSMSAEAIGTIVETVAGRSLGGGVNLCGDGMPALGACINFPMAVAAGPDGSIYVADWDAQRVGRITPDGIFHVFAGTGQFGFSGDGGDARLAKLYNPAGVSVGPDGTVYIADNENHRIRAVDTNGIIRTVLQDRGRVLAVVAAPDGNIYFGEDLGGGESGIKKLSPNGTVTTVVGCNAFEKPCCFDLCGGVPPTDLIVQWYQGFALGPDGSLYFPTPFRHVVRRIGPDGAMTIFAGTGDEGYSGDGGPATAALLDNPRAVTVSPEGDVYIADTYRVRKVGTDGIIRPVAGVGAYAFGPEGDNGPALFAGFTNIYGMAVGPDGALYIPDLDNDRIRRLAAVSPESIGQGELAVASQDGLELFVFDVYGRHLRTLDAFTGGVLYTFTYDGAGYLAQMTDMMGNVTTIQRGAKAPATAIVASGGQRTTLQYDANGFLNRIANEAGESVQCTYAADGLMLTLRSPRSNMWQFEYDALGRLTRDTNPEGGFTQLVRTDYESGYRIDVSTAMGIMRSYDAQVLPDGRLRRLTTHPNGLQTELFISPDGMRTVVFPDGSSATTIDGPDPRWGMQAPVTTDAMFTTPGGLTTILTASRTATLSNPQDLTSLNSHTETVTVNGRTYTRAFDAGQNRYTLTSAEGRTMTVVVDAEGRPTAVQLPGLDELTVGYDGLGRLAQIGQGAQQWQYAYDARNRVSARTLAGTNVRLQYQYDTADRLVRFTLPSGRAYLYGYDADGNMDQLTMPSGAVHTFDFNLVNHAAGYTPPGSARQDLDYDLDQFRTQVTLPGGRTIAYQYDTAARPIGFTYPEASVSFDYGNTNQAGAGCCGSSGTVASITRTPTAGGTAQTIAYDYDGTLMTGMIWSGVADGSYSYRYDDNFFLVGLTFNAGTETALPRDADGALTGYGPFTITRLGPLKTPSRISDGTASLDYTYDSAGRLAGRTLTVAATQGYAFQATRDAGGLISQNVQTVSGTSHTFAYAYDLDGQLSETRRDGALVESYTYDLNGNRTVANGAAATYDGQDRMLTRGGVSYTFNVDGFLAARGADTFTYSARGELLQATASGQTITYAYDALGRRVGRTDTNGTYVYLYGNPSNPFQITAARDTSGVLSEYFYDGAGLLFAFRRSGGLFYVGADPIGSPRVVMNTAGAVVKAVEYDSFGLVTSDSAPAFDLPIGFAGGLSDGATGIIRFGLRDYEPASGRWTAKDPILFAGSPENLYAYVHNNPVNFADPSGLFCIGGSGYAGIGAGGQVCVTGEGMSFCAEVGFGAGGGLEVDPFGDLAREGQYIDVALKAMAGPLGVGVKWTLDDCGDLHFKPECQFGPIYCSGKARGKLDDLGKPLTDIYGNSLDKLLTPNDGGKFFGGDLKDGLAAATKGIKIQGKIAGRACAAASW